MAALAFALLLLFAMFAGSEAAWCTCNKGLSDSVLQKTLDYACGAGADCTPISQNGACYMPNNVPSHCSYAANSYYQRKGQVQGACDFSGTATLTTVDPSYSGCTYPATPSAAGTSSSPGTNTTTGFTPNTGGFGSLGPSSFSPDPNHGALLKAGMGSVLLLSVVSSGMALF